MQAGTHLNQNLARVDKIPMPESEVHGVYKGIPANVIISK